MAVSNQLLVDPYWNMLVMQRSTYDLRVPFTITLDRGENIAFRAISVKRHYSVACEVPSVSRS